jgi:predicted phosphodiesterase
MRKLLQYLFKKPLTWVANNLSAKPEREAVFASLNNLYSSSKKNNKRVCPIYFNANADKFIIFSDQHKGNGDAADDFSNNQNNYIAALTYYHQQNFTFINLGDSEELWKYKTEEVLPQNERNFASEAKFQPDRYYKTFGNHDILWKSRMDVEGLLKKYFTMPLPVYEGIVLKANINQQTLTIFCTHGHQGDKLSDNNAFSTWIVAHIWAPIQRYLRINTNTPSKDDTLRNKHNKLMYEWSSQRQNTLLVTGHTHKPVFASGRYSGHPNNNINTNDDKIKPTYFNTGCCCFADGDITGIEIAEGEIRLVKWHFNNNKCQRKLLEAISLHQLLADF